MPKTSGLNFKYVFFAFYDIHQYAASQSNLGRHQMFCVLDKTCVCQKFGCHFGSSQFGGAVFAEFWVPLCLYTARVMVIF
jgi:hypothetical protein